MTNSSLWYGVLPGGACGMFDPSQTKPYITPDKPLTHVSGSLSPHPTRSSARALRSSLLRSDIKRHTYTGKRTIQRNMISSPQGDVKHTGHVGLDGAYFGDISFLDPAGCPPRQVVTPYKPSEDLEQVPLINPNSPSHLTAASCTPPYPLLSPNKPDKECDEVDLPCEIKTKHVKKSSHKSISEPTTSKSILNKVKNATLGRAHKAGDSSASKNDEVHEYHEISDTDTESNATDAKPENPTQPESPGITKTNTDFSQSLFDEMESMFRSLDGRRRDEPSITSKHLDIDATIRSHTLNKAEKKKSFESGTMKLMSAHDQKTLETAMAMADEITTKSMNDLGGYHKLPNSPSDRSKFHFKFPLVSLHHHTPYETEKDTSTGKQERRNFSEEAKSVPDIQSTITEESKLAYTSLIEEPTPSVSLISHIAKDAGGLHKPATIPKPARAAPKPQFHSLQKYLPHTRTPFVGDAENQEFKKDVINELPLPPRTNKPKLVDKPRHFRKYPLRLPDVKPPVPMLDRPIIYQNANCTAILRASKSPQLSKKNGVDVHDGPALPKDTNPFVNEPGPSRANPFNRYFVKDDIDIDIDVEERSDDSSEEKESKEGALVKDCTDHVSVEDLLEFADQKPCGRQRGVESDEVRIMCKVLKQQVTPEQCLEALELYDWNVHQAIKVVRVKISAGSDVALELCRSELENATGDIAKAAAAVMRQKNDDK